MPDATNQGRSSDIGSGEGEATTIAGQATVGFSAPSAQKRKRTTAPLSRRDALEILQTAVQNAQAAGVQIVASKIRNEAVISVRIAATQCRVCGIWRLDDDMETAVMCQHCADTPISLSARAPVIFYTDAGTMAQNVPASVRAGTSEQ